MAALAFFGVASAADAASSSSSVAAATGPQTLSHGGGNPTFTGSEVLGCAFDSAAWTANACAGGGGDATYVIHFTPHNLSGPYTKSWTVTRSTGGTVSNCSSLQLVGCISGGCTSTSTTCDVTVISDFRNNITYTASLQLTQSGLTKTISASALVHANPDSCLRC